MFLIDQQEFNTVKSFLDSKLEFQRVYFVPLTLKGKSWGCCPSYPTNEELLFSFSNDVCCYEINYEPDCVKRSLIVYTDKALKPGILKEGALI